MRRKEYNRAYSVRVLKKYPNAETFLPSTSYYDVQTVYIRASSERAHNKLARDYAASLTAGPDVYEVRLEPLS